MSDTDAQARALLGSAAAYISEHGHHKGAMFANEPSPAPACAIGSLVACGADMGMGLPDSAFSRAQHLLTNKITESYGGSEWEINAIADWNDDPATTAEDVILTMKRLAHE